ncbi:MAG: MmgE/PrpD family protein [Bradyrhizobium sp.]
MNAAFLNGVSSHIFDYDDTPSEDHHPSGRPGCLGDPRAVGNAAGVGQGFSQRAGARCRDECRIGNSVYPNHYDVGWHITGTAGVFGAARRPASCSASASSR